MTLALPVAALLLLTPAAAMAQTTDAQPADSQSADIGAIAASGAKYSLDTPIATLIADPAAKAVLDKDLPGMSTDEHLDQFKAKSLRQLQPMTGGQLTDALLKKTGNDLVAIGSGDAAPASDAADTATDSPPPATDDATSDETPAPVAAPPPGDGR